MSIRKIFILFFSMHSFYALAIWDETGRSIDGVAYVDVASIQRNGTVARITTLLDLFQPNSTKNGIPYRSMQSINDYDCKNILTSTAQITTYSKGMASGNVLFSHNYEPKWKPFPQDGSDIIHYKIACGLRVKK